MRHAKIVCTVGPATRDIDNMRKLLDAGMNVVRINMAHGSYDDHAATIRNVRELEIQVDRPIAVLMDLAGPKIRIGDIDGGETMLSTGQEFTVTTRSVSGTNEIVSINYPDLPHDIRVGDTILVDEGLIVLEVVSISGPDVTTKVIEGGQLNSRRGVHLPDIPTSISPLSEKDLSDLDFGLKEGVDWVGLSFVRHASDVKALKALIRDAGSSARVLAKIEKQEAVTDIDAILQVSDGIMIARGDLGIEMAPEKVPFVQKSIIGKCLTVGKPVITATQMLDSMIRNPRPTRAEVSDVANAILDGSDAVMLSGETAMGKFPAESVVMMAKTIQTAEAVSEYCIPRDGDDHITTTEAISSATCEIAYALAAGAIITATQSGETARQVAKHRPAQPIVAVSPSLDVVRQLTLSWGVIPLRVGPSLNLDNMFDIAVEGPLNEGLIKKGDRVVITAGVTVNMPGTTNLIKVQRV